MAADKPADPREAILAGYIARELAYDSAERTIGRNDPLLGDLLDSVAILSLVVFIEEQFGVRVEDDELVPENFETVRALSAFIAGKLAPG